MELEDRCEDEILLRLKLEEELAAINKDGLTDPDGVFAFSLDQPDALDMPLEEDKGSKKLPAFPEMIQDQLPQRIKRYKDQAVKRKSTFKQADERLTEEGCKGHEKLGPRVNLWVYLLLLGSGRPRILNKDTHECNYRETIDKMWAPAFSFK